MTVEEAILRKIIVLPPNRQQELLDFAELFEEKEAKLQTRKSLYGMLSDLDIKITEEDIDKARKEMWGNFPREHFFEKEVLAFTS